MSKKVIMTVEGRGLDYSPILQYLQENGYEAQWLPGPYLTSETLLGAVKGADAVIAGMESWNADALEQMSGSLKIISRYGIGFDTVDVAAAHKLGIVVTNTPGVLSQAVAELALTQLLTLSRRMSEFDRMLHQGEWSRPQVGHNVAGKTVGIIGFGDIGQHFAKLLGAFGCRILAFDPRFNNRAGESLGVEQADMDMLLKESDCISLHLAVTPQTEGMVNAELLGKMKPGAYLINTSRGKIINDEALIQALQSGHLGGAALDVFHVEPLPQDHHFRGVPNLVLTPHIGSATAESFLEAGMVAAKNVHDCLSGGTPAFVVKPPVA